MFLDKHLVHRELINWFEQREDVETVIDLPFPDDGNLALGLTTVNGDRFVVTVQDVGRVSG